VPAESQGKPSLLFLCQTLPYPLDSGVAIRSYHLLKILSRAFDVTALCFYRRKNGLAPADPAPALAVLGQFARVEAFPLPQEHSAVRLAWDHVRSVTRRRVYSAFTFESRPFTRRLRELLAERRFDLAHVDSIWMSRYVPVLAGRPVVFGHHNVESALLQRRANAERGWRSAYLSFQARLMEREERRWCAASTLNVTVSDDDRVQLETIAGGSRWAVVPNGVDTEWFRPARGREDGLVCVGELGWFPNHDGLRYFSEDILPRIRAAGHDVPVRWVGRAPEATVRTYREQHGVELTGYVNDIRPLVHDAACYVVPLRVGGGTRVKILDAWAMGKAVVSTSVGCEGLAAEDGRNILVRDDPEGFAQAVGLVLQDGALRRRLGAEGRRTVEQSYDWGRIGESVLPSYTSLVAPRREKTTSAAPAVGSSLQPARFPG
jgi:glycosyltransferase involved in cell wall biosynthesis